MTTLTANQHISSEISSFNARGANLSAAPSKAQRITGRVLTGLVSAFLIVDAVVKLVMLQPVVEGSAKLGYPVHTMYGIGVALLVSTVLYLIPRTALLGAVLLTGYMGGAIATHVRVEDPLFSHTLFPTYLAAMFWGGLFLRDARLRAFLPWRNAQ
jgi:hypothetical protein